MTECTDILEFWFGDPNAQEFGEHREAWFQKDEVFDAEIRTRFGKDVAKASAGSYDSWEATPGGTLALIVMLDQFPRNIFRGLPKAFAADAKARSIARRAIDRGIDRDFVTVQRLFTYLPFEHSENLADQRKCVALYSEILPDFDVEFREKAHFSVYRHCEIIERFGRFPHRNEAIGRESSAEELEFLKEPRSSF
ncbi:MAG: hypothetical protein CL569_15160 [Alphaproteobacteria bacterium]|nr:hypothetical protein [Alphaproteobacteria bacterium]|tara:strand:- start:153 stop:737 length:585 start_codon:yes stop_codon:yes gene_type:complete